jgi:hypothetical protein
MAMASSSSIEWGSRTYRTIYGVGRLAPGIATGAPITVGQLLGQTEVFTRMIGRTTVTYSMTHFQVDDFSSMSGITNHHAVPPERFLSPAARQLAAQIWRTARYSQQIVEPFLDNPRDVVFPLTRVWTSGAGGLAPRIEITAASASSIGYRYVFRDAAGALMEAGSVELDVLARPYSAIDFRPDGSSAVRRGIYAIADGQMEMAYGSPGEPRPTALAGGSTYRTH